MKEQFINFMREKGVEPTQEDIDTLCSIAMSHSNHEKLSDIANIVYNDSSSLAKQIWIITQRP